MKNFNRLVVITALISIFNVASASSKPLLQMTSSRGSSGSGVDNPDYRDDRSCSILETGLLLYKTIKGNSEYSPILSSLRTVTWTRDVPDVETIIKLVSLAKSESNLVRFVGKFSWPQTTLMGFTSKGGKVLLQSPEMFNSIEEAQILRSFLERNCKDLL